MQSKGNYGKKQAKSKGQSVATLSQVKQIIRSSLGNVLEHKFFNTNLAMTALAYTGATYQLSAVPQGITDYNRTGDVFTVKRIRIRLQVIAGDATNMVRVIIFSWFPNTTPAIGDIMTAVSTAEAPLTQNVHDNLSKMKIYADFIVAVATSQLNVVKDLNLKCSAKVQANNASTTLGTNHIWIGICSDSAAATHPSLGFACQILFEDA